MSTAILSLGWYISWFLFPSHSLVRIHSLFLWKAFRIEKLIGQVSSRAESCANLLSVHSVRNPTFLLRIAPLLVTINIRVLNILEESVRLLGYKSVRLDGQTPVLDRQPLIDEFNNNRVSSGQHGPLAESWELRLVWERLGQLSVLVMPMF